MRASRLLSILLLLQTRGRMTATQLAEEFETSVRTIYRDIDQLSAAGVPVYAERGPNGGFSLLEGYRTRLTGLSAAEAETLFLSGLPGAAADLGLGDTLATAQLKVLAALTADGRKGAERLARRFHLDPVSWFRDADAHAGLLPVLTDAVCREREVKVSYETWDKQVERTLQPLGLAQKAGVWYLIAAVDGAARTYRVSSIRALEATDVGFERPADFDLPAFWAAWVARFEARLVQGEATLRLSPKGLRKLCQLGPAMERAARAAGPPDARGWVQAVVPTEDLDHACADILKLGGEVEVLAPPDLRARVAAEAVRIASMYAPENS